MYFFPSLPPFLEMREGRLWRRNNKTRTIVLVILVTVAEDMRSKIWVSTVLSFEDLPSWNSQDFWGSGEAAIDVILLSGYFNTLRKRTNPLRKYPVFCRAP